MPNITIDGTSGFLTANGHESPHLSRRHIRDVRDPLTRFLEANSALADQDRDAGHTPRAVYPSTVRILEEARAA